MPQPPTTYILSYERPLYLWATLDSLYRATRTDMRFVLIDSASRDPLVGQVIEGFSRRHMFDQVLRLEHNDSAWFGPYFAAEFERIGPYFYSVESDVILREEATCWAARMLAVMQANPRLAMLGSAVDTSDFIDVDALERKLGRKLGTEERKQLKLASPERTMAAIGADEVSAPFNPPGRVLALRTDAMQAHITRWEESSDYQMDLILKANGWQTGIYGGVVHRHLSLCNYYDYPVYSMAGRDAYMKSKG